jgi:methyl-accepting chemotaxis protein
MLGYFSTIHATLDEETKTFYSKEGMEVLATLRNGLPAYENSLHDLYDRIRAKDLAGALTQLNEVNRAGKPFQDGAALAIEIKVKRGEEKFLLNNEQYQSARNLVIGVSGISLLIGMFLSIFIARSFALPLGQAVAVLEKVAEGDLTAVLEVDTKDEVGRMALALNRAVEKLNSTLQEVADSAANASSSSQQLAAAAEAIASGAQEQAASLEETSASLEEITAAVRQSADNAQQASQLAAGSKDSALQGQ